VHPPDVTQHSLGKLLRESAQGAGEGRIAGVTDQMLFELDDGGEGGTAFEALEVFGTMSRLHVLLVGSPLREAFVAHLAHEADFLLVNQLDMMVEGVLAFEGLSTVWAHLDGLGGVVSIQDVSSQLVSPPHVRHTDHLETLAAATGVEIRVNPGKMGCKLQLGDVSLGTDGTGDAELEIECLLVSH